MSVFTVFPVYSRRADPMERPFEFRYTDRLVFRKRQENDKRGRAWPDAMTPRPSKNHSV